MKTQASWLAVAGLMAVGALGTAAEEKRPLVPATEAAAGPDIHWLGTRPLTPLRAAPPRISTASRRKTGRLNYLGVDGAVMGAAIMGMALTSLGIWHMVVTARGPTKLQARCEERYAVLSRVAKQWGGVAKQNGGYWPVLHVPLFGGAKQAIINSDPSYGYLPNNFTEFRGPVRSGSKPWRLLVRPRGGLDGFGALVGLEELHVGYAEIDDRFVVKSDSFIQVAVYFAEAETRDALLAIVRLHGDSPVELELGRGRLLVRKTGFLESEASSGEFLRACLALYRQLPSHASFPLG